MRAEVREANPGTIRIRTPGLEDAAAVYRLIEASPPLDLNSAYVYCLLCDHFRDTTVVAEHDGDLLGCLTGYRRPDAPEVLFIWQVAVHADARGKGLARRMLDAVINLPAARDTRWVETTISPSNAASRRLFERWAASHGMDLESSPYLEPHHFPAAGKPGSGHEAEHLFRIGPLPGPRTAQSHEGDETQ